MGSNPASPTGCEGFWGEFPPNFPPKLIEVGVRERELRRLQTVTSGHSPSK